MLMMETESQPPSVPGSLLSNPSGGNPSMPDPVLDASCETSPSDLIHNDAVSLTSTRRPGHIPFHHLDVAGPSRVAPRIAGPEVHLPSFPGWYVLDAQKPTGVRELIAPDYVPGIPIGYDYVHVSRYYELRRMVASFHDLVPVLTREIVSQGTLIADLRCEVSGYVSMNPHSHKEVTRPLEVGLSTREEALHYEGHIQRQLEAQRLQLQAQFDQERSQLLEEFAQERAQADACHAQERGELVRPLALVPMTQREGEVSPSGGGAQVDMANKRGLLEAGTNARGTQIGTTNKQGTIWRAPIDSSAPTGQSSDWQEELFQKIKAMNEMYLPELNEMYKKITADCQQQDQIERQKNLKIKGILKHLIDFLQVSKDNVLPADEDKLGTYEEKICLFLNSRRYKN